jgi:hypothetical protein
MLHRRRFISFIDIVFHHEQKHVGIVGKVEPLWSSIDFGVRANHA